MQNRGWVDCVHDQYIDIWRVIWGCILREGLDADPLSIAPLNVKNSSNKTPDQKTNESSENIECKENAEEEVSDK